MHRKILIVGTNMMNIYHHRLELIQTLINSNYDVVVAAPKGGEEVGLKKIGCKFIHTPVDNRGTNIKNDLGLLRNLVKICRKEKPDVILTFYTKTNIYGGLVARMLKIPYVENITGLGSSLAGGGKIFKIMSFLYKEAVKSSFIVFFQNQSNYKFFTEKKLYKGRSKLLPGSGVSLERYVELPYPKSDTVEFLFISRILKEKGIEEYLKAAEIIKRKYPKSIFHVVGPCEPQYENIIHKADSEGIIQYHGKLYDVKNILNSTHCTVLPSYYPEGMANVLLESAASGRPIITTKLPGCGETVENNVTGFTVEEKNVDALVKALEKFILLKAEEKEKMGKEGRRKMEKEFDRNVVTKEYMRIIEEIFMNR